MQYVEFECTQCNIKLLRHKKYLYSGYRRQSAKYCSRECFAESRKSQLTTICPVCNKSYTTIKSRLDRGWVCCSNECRKKRDSENRLTKEQLRLNAYYSRIKKEYGLTKEDWQILYDKYEGRCHICKEFETEQHLGKTRRLDVDHCHKTGKVRGLLCTKCNKLLGCAKDNTATLASAIEYLKCN